ncbi:hypothetical protein AO269_21315 [Pseudomonas putida]|nr:hypothetical protein AO269_21315 [Pseudomonas putida]
MHAFLGSRLRVLVDNQLMPVEIEVDPLRTRAAFGEPEHFTVEMTCGRQVVDRYCEMKRRKAHGNFLWLCFDLKPFLSANA